MPTELSRAGLPRLVLGLGLLVVGAVLLGDNLGLFDAGPVMAWLPAIAALALGAAWLLQGRRCVVQGIVASGVGLVLLARALGYRVQIDLGGLFIAGVLFLLGIRLVGRALGTATTPAAAESNDLGSTVDNLALLAGNELRSAARAFRGGSLSAFMGGCKLDLREAHLPPEGAEIDVFTVWGGIEIRVPERWRVESRVVPMLGGYEDTTRLAPGETEGTLTLRGWAIMGAVEVGN